MTGRPRSSGFILAAFVAVAIVCLQILFANSGAAGGRAGLLVERFQELGDAVVLRTMPLTRALGRAAAPGLEDGRDEGGDGHASGASNQCTPGTSEDLDDTTEHDTTEDFDDEDDDDATTYRDEEYGEDTHHALL